MGATWELGKLGAASLSKESFSFDTLLSSMTASEVRRAISKSQFALEALMVPVPDENKHDDTV